MMRQYAIFEEWQARLAVCEREIAAESTSGRWRRQIEAKILRFLLAFYRMSNERRAIDPHDPTPDSPSPKPPLRIVVEGGQGKPARSATAIQSALTSLRTAQSHREPPGPLAEGTGQNYPICVMSFDEFGRAASYRSMLRDHQLSSELERDGNLIRMMVATKDCAAAREILNAPIPQRPLPARKDTWPAVTRPFCWQVRFAYLVLPIVVLSFGLAVSLQQLRTLSVEAQLTILFSGIVAAVSLGTIARVIAEDYFSRRSAHPNADQSHDEALQQRSSA